MKNVGRLYLLMTSVLGQYCIFWAVVAIRTLVGKFHILSSFPLKFVLALKYSLKESDEYLQKESNLTLWFSWSICLFAFTRSTRRPDEVVLNIVYSLNSQKQKNLLKFFRITLFHLVCLCILKMCVIKPFLCCYSGFI